MRRWIALAAVLYPKSFRSRYGEEFHALLDDYNPGWREFTDVFRGALKMQLTDATTYWKLAGGLAILGALAATAVSLRVPRIYQSTAVMRITPRQVPETRDAQGGWIRGANPQQAVQEKAALQLNEMEQEILSRTNLENIITSPYLDLYKEERSREPMEDIVLQMRNRDIKIQTIGAGPAFSVSFSYPDRLKAQAVVRGLMAQFIEQNAQVDRSHAMLWHSIWPELAPPPGARVEVLDPASNPQRPINAGPAQFAAIGLTLGLALGLVAATAIRHPKWTLQMAGFALGFCTLALAISALLPERYTSDAVLRLTPPLVPADPGGKSAPADPAAKLQRLEKGVLSEFSLKGIVTDPQLNLYKKERTQQDIHALVETLRRNLRIQLVGRSAFWISFSYSDPEKAQAVVRILVTRFTEENVVDERQVARASGDAKAIEIADHRVGAEVEVLDPPSDPVEPAFPDRMKMAFAGFALGIVIGAITLQRRRPRVLTPQPA